MRFGNKLKSGYMSFIQGIRKIVCCESIPEEGKEKDDELKTV